MKPVRTNAKRRRGLPLLKKWRAYRGNLTQARLAERAGVSQGMISQLENGESDYTGALLEALSEALQCEPADLIMRDPTDPEGIWSLWDQIKPEQRRMAANMLRLLAGDKAA